MLYPGSAPAFSLCLQFPLKVVKFPIHVFLMPVSSGLMPKLAASFMCCGIRHVLISSRHLFLLFEEMLKSLSLLKLAGVSDPVFKMLLQLWRLRHYYGWFGCPLDIN